MAYRWSKKRIEARKRLVTLALFYVLALPFNDALLATKPSSEHPVWTVVLALLIIGGLYSIASDIRVLIFDDEPDEEL